jgi:hypothetical protein
MKCENCGDLYAYSFKWVQTPQGIVSQGCDRCGGARSTIHDVYFKEPYFDPYLSSWDDKDNTEGNWITSKAQKAELMKKYHVREAGDRVHGATSFDPISHRHAQESLRRKKS